MSDWLDDEVPIEWLAALLETIHLCPHLDFQLLTKRPENWRTRILGAWGYLTAELGTPFSVWLARWNTGFAPVNVWIGITVENQEWADKRREHFKLIPATVYYVSYEPALRAVDWTGWEFLNQLIAGGESGRSARPSHPQWFMDSRDWCAENGIAFLFKQWGEFVPYAIYDYYPENSPLEIVNLDGSQGWVAGDVADGALINSCNDQEGWSPASRVGKKVAGRLLDGVEHNGFPQTPQTSKAI